MKQSKCPICKNTTSLLDVVDFNKSCEEARGKFLPLSGKPIYYEHCRICGFTHAPEFSNWTDQEFLDNIYNEQYIEVDPDYQSIRPTHNFDNIKNMFSNHKTEIKHLDYGGGNGELSRLLSADGWNSTSYDPFPNNDDISSLGKYNLITSFEVFEHVPNIDQLMKNLLSLMDKNCLILFTTLV